MTDNIGSCFMHVQMCQYICPIYVSISVLVLMLLLLELYKPPLSGDPFRGTVDEIVNWKI